MTYTPKKDAKYSISYLTTCQNRTWQLKQTLHLSIENSLSYAKNVQFVLLNYYSTDDLHEYVHEELKEHLDSGKLVYIDANSIYPRTDSVTFDRSKAKNMVAKYATGDILCWLDADNIALQGFSEYINDCFCFNTDIVLQGDFRIAHDVGGRIVCMRSDYERSKGYDESLVGYNHEDVKFVAMLVESLDLKRLFIHKRWLENSFVSNKSNIFDYFSNIYCINLGKMIHKKLGMEIQSEKIHKDIIFFPAFDENEEKVREKYNEYTSKYESKEIRQDTDYGIIKKGIENIGVIGLIYTTLRLYESLQNKGNVLIIEDDIFFHKNINNICISDKIQNADFVMLGYNSTNVCHETDLFFPVPFKNYKYNLYGTYGYICSQNFRKYIMSLGIDYFINKNTSLDLGFNYIRKYEKNTISWYYLNNHLLIPDVLESTLRERRNNFDFYKQRNINVNMYHYIKYDELSFKFIIPSYNNENWIYRNLDSVCNQNYNNYEIIYINDCSTDNTNDIAKTYIQHNKNLIVRNTNTRKFQAYARYIGYRDALDEEILIFLDGDDWLVNNYVLKFLNLFYSYYDLDATYGSYYIFENNKINYKINNAGKYSDKVKKDKSYHLDIWRCKHLRTVKAKFIKYIHVSYLTDHNDEYLKCSTDWAESFYYLKNCNKIDLVYEPLCVYNKDNSKTTFNTFYRDSEFNSNYRKQVNDLIVKRYF